MSRQSQYVYMLRCSDGTLYTGWTNDLEKRLTAHNSGTGAKYTRSRRPVELVFCEAYETKAEAMRREAEIKTFSRSKKQRMIELYGIEGMRSLSAEAAGKGLGGAETCAPDPRLLDDEHWMRRALREAEKAAALGEVPIGCVIVSGGKVVGRGYNRRNTRKTTLAHAEMLAIDQASRRLGDWRLEGCTMYVTLEPCQMCAGALVQSRIDRCVIGAMNPKAGCVGSLLDIPGMPLWNHTVEITRGVLEDECSKMLKSFFKELRVKVKKEKTERERM